MKNNLFTRSLLIVYSLTMTVSCDEFLDDNIDPNNTLVNPPSLILSSVTGSIGFHMQSDLLRYSALWSQQLAAQNGRQTENYDRYVLADTEVNGVWRGGLYGGVLADVEEILKKSPQETHPHYFGIAKVVKAYTFSILVDFWGDIPYFEALQGVSNLTPEVDDDALIYPALITLLDEAIVSLKATSPLTTVGADDLIFGGSTNISKWIRTANVLKLRLYLHMANVQGYDPTEMNSFITNTPLTEFMTGVTDDFQLRYESITRRQNPFHQFILTRTDDICTSSTIINLMNSKSDPRRASYFTPSPFSPTLLSNPPMDNTGYKGLQNGFGNGGVDNSLSRLHTFVRGRVTSTSIPAGPNLAVGGLVYDGTAPTNMLTYSEYNFIRAEMALRYGSPVAPKSSVEEWYREGIRASILDSGLSNEVADTYLATSAGNLTGTAEEQLKMIIEEKYVANFMVTGEPWSDWRRTGYPLLQLLPGTLNPGNGGKVPRVLIYPQQEVDSNPFMIQRPDMKTGKVFWDTRTTGQE